MKLELTRGEFALICDALHARGAQWTGAGDAKTGKAYHALAQELPERAARGDKEYPTADWPATKGNPSWTF